MSVCGYLRQLHNSSFVYKNVHQPRWNTNLLRVLSANNYFKMGGRGVAPCVFVNENTILTSNQLRAEKAVSYMDFKFTDTLECIRWMVRRRLLKNNYFCVSCQIAMSLVKRAEAADGFQWRCKKCRSTVSIRKDSFFYKSNLPLFKQLAFIYGWTKNYKQKDIAHEAQIGPNSNHTTVAWSSSCREVCKHHLLDHPITIGGLNEDGTSKIVELEESKVFHSQNKRGQWVFGGVERESGDFFFVVVPDRTLATLAKHIKNYIRPGTIIISNGLQAYNEIGEIDGGIYEYHMDQDRKFVHPGICTIHIKTIEKLWMRKRYKPSLHEFVWRNKFRRKDLFIEFILCLIEQYPL